jgi:uncharacterized membrane protein
MKEPPTTMEHRARSGRSKTMASRCHSNVGSTERWLSALAGTALVTYGLERRSRASAAEAVIGGVLFYRGLTGRCPLYQALGTTTARSPATAIPAGRGTKIQKSITVRRRPEDVYNFWRHFENLPSFMQNLQEVQTRGDRSHWAARGPLGTIVEWDAEILVERPFEAISWKSLPGGDIDCAGSVHFRDLGAERGTEVNVVLKYNPPAGKMGASVAALLGDDPDQMIADDLCRFKKLMDSAEMATSRRR